MLLKPLAHLAALMPSKVKYKLGFARPLYTRVRDLGKPSTIVTTDVGTICWPTDRLTSQQHLLGTYERYMQAAFRRFVRPGSVVYDIGANVGFHSLYCGLLGATVFAFEPHPAVYPLLERRAAANPLLRIRTLRLAVGATDEPVRFNTKVESSQGRVDAGGDTIVQCCTLDTLVTSQNLDPPSILKIDVEGSEESVLRGALTLIRRYRPVVILDWNDGSTPAVAESVLSTLGYAIDAGSPILCHPPAAVLGQAVCEAEA